MIAIAIYAIISIYFGRKNPLFYMILPLALQQGEAAFINQYIAIGGKNILSPYYTIFNDVLFFITLGITVGIMKVKYKKVKWIGTTLITIFFVYVIFLWLRSFLNYPNVNEVFLTGRRFMYISLSYYLWVAILASVTREEYEGFVRMMFYVTPVSTFIYILNSAKIVTLFDDSLVFQEVDFGNESFLRDFRTIPLWLIPVLVLSIQTMITPTFKIDKKVVIANILLLPVGLLFTFTRSYLVVVFIEVGFLLMLYSYKFSFKLVTNIVLLVGFIAITLMVIQKVFPNQANYFSERLLSAKSEGKNEHNVNLRMEYLNEANEIVSATNPWLGEGMDRRYYLRMDMIGAWGADSTIPMFLLHTGWVGVILIFGTVLIFFIDSLLLFIKTKDWMTGYLSAFFLALFISSLIMGETLLGSVWVLMNFSWYSVIKFNKWKLSEEEQELLEIAA